MKFKIATLLVLAIWTVPAAAWGDREQGIAAGVAGTLALQHMMQHRQMYVRPQYGPQYAPQYAPAYPSYTHRPMYRSVDIFIPECNCYRTMMIQIN